MQRAGSEGARGPGGKRGGGKRGAGRRVLSVVGSPLMAAALLAAILLYSSHRFSHFTATDASAGRSGFFDGRSGSAASSGQHGGRQAGGGTAEPGLAAGTGSGSRAGSDVLDPLQQKEQQQAHRHGSWLTAALLWAEEHHAARVKAKVGRIAGRQL